MSNWRESAARVNDAGVRSFGDPVTYQTPGSDPFTVDAVALQRSPDELDQSGSFEGLQIAEADFAAPPQKGDWVTLGDGTQYVVSDIRDPNPFDGKKVLILTRRGPAAR